MLKNNNITSIEAGQPSPAAPGERRELDRQEFDVIAYVITNTNQRLFECNICDITTAGARIQSERVGTMPRKFKLYIEAARLMAPCEVIWCRGRYAGVKFIEDEVFMMDVAAAC